MREYTDAPAARAGSTASRPISIVICWDGGNAVRHTVEAMLPLLHRAGGIELLILRDAAYQTVQALGFLNRLGLRRPVRMHRNGPDPVDIALRNGARWNADWCIMGLESEELHADAFGGLAGRMIGHPPCALIIGR